MSDLIFPPFAPVPPRPSAAPPAPRDAAQAPPAAAAAPAPAPVPAPFAEPEEESRTTAHPAFGSGVGAVEGEVAGMDQPEDAASVTGPAFGSGVGIVEDEEAAPVEDAVSAAGAEPADEGTAMEDLMPWDSPAPVAPLTPGDVVGAVEPAAAEADDEAVEDLPWLEIPAGAPQAAAPAPGPAEPAREAAEAGGGEETPDWMAWAGPEVVGGSPAGITESPELPSPGSGQGAAARAGASTTGEEAQAPAAMEDVTAFGRSDLETVPPVMGLAPVGDFTFPEDAPAPAPSRYLPEPEPEEPEWERPAMPAPARAASAGVPEGVAAALGEVADRLERIARDLRERPEAVLSGAHAHGGDALGLLVTGFALGYAQRGGER